MITVEARISQIENRIGIVETKAKKTDTWVLPVAVCLAIAGYALFVAKLPALEYLSPLKRLLVGGIGGWIGLMLFCLSLGMVRAALKALVEVAFVVLGILNAVACVLTWTLWDDLKQIMLQFGSSPHANIGVATFFAVAFSILLFDAICFLFLDPLSRIVGSGLSEWN